MTMESEPNFFTGDHDVIEHDVALVSQNNNPIACGSRLLRRVFWEGAERNVAYLAHLRLHPTHHKRGGRALIAGYQMLSICAKQLPAVATWTAIFTNNTSAQSALIGKRAGLPEYVARGNIHSKLVLIKRKQHWPTEQPCSRANASDMPAITRFLQQHLCRRFLAPCLDEHDLTNGLRWPDLRAEDFVIVKHNEEIIAVTAVRDLRKFKQVRVIKLPLLWKIVRLPSLVLAALNTLPPIPQIGNILALGYASFFTVKNDDPITARILLGAAKVLASEKKLHFLSVAFHEHDRKRQATERMPSIDSNGIIYQVMLSGEREPWPDDTPYIDPANL